MEPDYRCPNCGSDCCDKQSGGGYDGVLCSDCRHYDEEAAFLQDGLQTTTTDAKNPDARYGPPVKNRTRPRK